MAPRVIYSLPDLPQRDGRPVTIPNLVRKRMNNDVQLRTRLVDAVDYLAPLDADDVVNVNADVSAAGRVNA